MHARRAVDALTADERRFDTVVTVTEVGWAQRQFPLTALVGAPADKPAAAVGGDVGIERAQRRAGGQVVKTAPVLPVVVDVAGNRQACALLGAFAVGVIGDFGLQGHITGTPLHTQALPAVVARAFFKVGGGVADTAEYPPVFIDGRAVEQGFDPPVTATGNRPAAMAFTGLGFDTQLGHLMHFAQALEALDLAIVRGAGDHVIGEHIELAPLLQIQRVVALGDFQVDMARVLVFGVLEGNFGTSRPGAGAEHVRLGHAHADIAGRGAHQGFQAFFTGRQIGAVGRGLGRQLLGGQPRVVGVTEGQPLEFNPRFLRARQVVCDGAGFAGLVVFQQGVVQRGAVYHLVAGVGVRRNHRLAIQRRSLFRQALIEVGGGHPAQGVVGQLHALSLQGFVVVEHLGGTCAGLERAQAVDAPAHHIVMGTGVRGPGGEQLVVILEGAVGDHKAFAFTARREFSQAHAFGSQVAFQAALGHRVQQAGVAGAQAQGRFRHTCTLQGDQVFAHHLGLVAGADKRLVEFEQRIIGLPGTGQRIAQGHTPLDILGLGRHQGAGTLHGFGGFAAIGQGHGQAQLQVRVARFAQQGLAIHRLGGGPALLIAVGAGHGGQRLGGQLALAPLGLIDLEYFVILARPTGDQQVIADLARGLALGRQLAQQVERWRVVAGTGLANQGIIGRIGHGQGRQQQGSTDQ